MQTVSDRRRQLMSPGRCGRPRLRHLRLDSLVQATDRYIKTHKHISHREIDIDIDIEL